MSSSFERVVIVGGSSGIGLATARTLLDRGYAVTIGGRDAARLASAAATLEGRATAVSLDAADQDRTRAVFKDIGAFDHLVLAAGSHKGLGPFAGIDMDEVRAGFAEKVFPHFATAQAALPHLAENGSVTFLAAVSAHGAAPGAAAIGAANAAITAMVPSLALELAPRRVNAVSPGAIDTPWWDFVPVEQRQAIFADFARRTPVRRIGTPDDIADAIAFLIGNSFMAAHTLICDGGARLAAAG